MPLLPYNLAKPFLFSMDPEVAHDVTMAGLAATQGNPLKFAYAAARVQDPVTVAGLIFPNRVGMAAGLDKNARCIDGLDAMGFGFIEVGTVTPKPQMGNPKPRMFRLPQAHALINRLGFNNDGLDAFVANVKCSALRRDGKSAVVLGLNIGKNATTPIENATSDYLACLNGVYPHADYITVNISSPNTKNLRALQSDDALDALLNAIAEKREILAKSYGKRKPIFIKIAPDLDEAQIAVIASTLKRYGTDAAGVSNNDWGVVATNTTLSRDSIQGLPHFQETGGLSGSPLLTMSNAVIRQLRSELGRSFPIIGVGGIMCADDAVSKIQAGADVVQIYTGLIYRGPRLVKDSALAIQRAARANAHTKP